MIEIKICGLRRVEDALVAAEVGASMLGFVFAPSRRRISPEAARDIAAGVRRRVGADVRLVGVFVDATADEINQTAKMCDLDLAQLSGNVPNEVIDALVLPAIKVLHVGAEDTSERLLERASATSAALLHLDTASPGLQGGTGETFEWSVVTDLGKPFLLAGGLHAGNVAEAILTARPWGVDVSSGVETDGEKDQKKIREFIATALTVEASMERSEA
jgi:phosphoribosylanthranilate isomerase